MPKRVVRLWWWGKVIFCRGRKRKYDEPSSFFVHMMASNRHRDLSCRLCSDVQCFATIHQFFTTISEVQMTQQQSSSTTPAPRKTPLRAVIGVAVVGIVGAAFGYGVVILFLKSSSQSPRPSSGSPLVDGVLAMLLTIVAMNVVLGIHEWGHVLGGQLSGFRFAMLVVGPLQVLRDGDRIVVGLNKNMSLVGGVASAVPTGNERDIQGAMLRLVAGGPVASLVLAFCAGLPFLTAKFFSFAAPHGLLALFLGATCAASFLIFVGTAIPYHANHFYSDGARVLMLRKRGKEGERWCALAILAGAMMNDTRPRDLNMDYLKSALALPDKTVDDLSAHVLAYQWALDSGIVEEAQRCLDYAATNLESYPEAFRPLVAIEVAYMEGVHRHNAEEAHKWLGQAGKSAFIEPPTRLRAEAALALAQDDIKAAKEKATEVLSVLEKKSRLNGSEQMERDLAEELLRRTSAKVLPSSDG